LKSPENGGGRGRGEDTLSFLQEEIECIYRVHAPPVGKYLIAREAAEVASGRPLAPEMLLVFEEEDALSLGLFLDEAVMAAARAADPHHARPRLTARTVLSQVTCATEGISHFVYLATRAQAGRPVSLLELEVQAEVDKFALLVLHLWRRRLRHMSRALRHRLFERVRYRAHLDLESLERYQTAHRLGSGYARWLEGRFVEEADIEGLLRELRASYRLGGGEKIGYLGTRGLH